MSKRTVPFVTFCYLLCQERSDILPRTARNLNEGGYRHVIVRGIGKQILFEDADDNIFFIGLLERYSRETGIGICAYCLMENHVHLLLHDGGTLTPLFMKKIGVSYSAHFNVRYERTGHLFQDRYKCENIKTGRQYLVVLRYILRNPEKAGICKTEEYKWSSYDLYGDDKSFLDQTYTCELLCDRDEFLHFITSDCHDSCMEYGKRRNDEWAQEVISSELGIESGTVIQTYNRKERNRAIAILKAAGLSIRQIERLTGINRGVIQKA